VENKFILAMAVIAVAVSILAAAFTYFSVVNLVTRLSGFATATGEINLTVESSASINFTDETISFGSGLVTAPNTEAFLDTTTGTVVQGNWTAETTGLVLQNIGSTNVSLNLSSNVAAAAFIGGTNPSFQWNVSENEVGSCLLSNGTVTASAEIYHELLDSFIDVNTSATAEFCELFPFADAFDSLRIDINLTIPQDATTGARGAIITAEAIACSCP